MSKFTQIFAIFSILFFFSCGGSAEEIYSQGFHTEKTSGIRVSRLPNFTIHNDEPTKNASGVYYDSFFTFPGRDGRDKYSANLKVINNATREVAFEGFSPYFDLAFEDSDSKFIVLVSSFEYTDFSLMILDQEGEVIVEQSFSYYLFEKFITLIEDKNSGVLGAPGMLDEEAYSRSENEKGQRESEVNEAVEEDEEQKIIIACGRIAKYIEQIKSLDFDHFGMIKGFQFISSDEHLYFNLNELSEFLNEQESFLVRTVENSFSMDCEQHNVSAININGRYIRKCTSPESTFVELWELDVNEKAEDFGFEQFKLLTNGTVNRTAYGWIENNKRVGVWKRLVEELDALDTCEYQEDLLEGNCISYTDDSDRYITPFLDGLAHGVEMEYYGKELYSSCEYYEGYKNGTCSTFEQGTIEEECTYYGESQIGVCTERFLNTDIISRQCDMLGEKHHGQCAFFNEDGTLKKTALFEFDEEVWSQVN